MSPGFPPMNLSLSLSVSKMITLLPVCKLFHTVTNSCTFFRMMHRRNLSSSGKIGKAFSKHGQVSRDQIGRGKFFKQTFDMFQENKSSRQNWTVKESQSWKVYRRDVQVLGTSTCTGMTREVLPSFLLFFWDFLSGSYAWQDTQSLMMKRGECFLENLSSETDLKGGGSP